MKKSDTIVTPSSSRSLRKNYSITPILKKITTTDTTTTTTTTTMTTTPQPTKTRLKPILKSPPQQPYHGITSNERIETWSRSHNKSVSTPVLFNAGNVSSRPVEKRVASLQTIKQKFLLKEPLPWEEYTSPVTANCQKSSNYDEMMKELNISHALGAASNFKTMSFVDADKLSQKFQHLKTVLESMYSTLRVQTDTTRATVMTLKLDAPQNKQFCQLSECAVKIEKLLDEFYFTNKYANHLESTYLQHLAGTLTQQKDDPILQDILTRLENIFYDNNRDFTQHIVAGTIPTTDIRQQIDSVIEKIARHFKLIHVFDRSKNSDTLEELTRQRERSASLVLELEKSRSRRLVVSEQNKSDSLKCQLMQQTSQRQTLQDRVTDLEHIVLIKDQEMEALKITIRKLQHNLKQRDRESSSASSAK